MAGTSAVQHDVAAKKAMLHEAIIVQQIVEC
jgi:hypothetical protein